MHGKAVSRGRRQGEESGEKKKKRAWGGGGVRETVAASAQLVKLSRQTERGGSGARPEGVLCNG